MSLEKHEQARIEAAIRDCERSTGGQIVCVLAESAMVQRTALPVLVAALVSLSVPWLLVGLTQLPVMTVLLLQALTFVVLLAAEQFVVRGVSRTPDRSGILIFVARAERYARIVADDGIARQVPNAQWRTAVEALVTHMREDRVAEGFIAAIVVCTDILKAHRPPATEAPNALPDRVYQI
jgi:putative membrane protein